MTTRPTPERLQQLRDAVYLLRRDAVLTADEIDLLAELFAELDALAAERDEARQWVRDLHSGMYVNCVYCGHRYGPKDEVPASMADVLKEHIGKCPKHPLSEANARIADLERQLAQAAEHEKLAEAQTALIKHLLEDLARLSAK